MKILVNEKISQHKYKTPEGYLICVDSVLARTGPQTYRKNELFVDAEDDSEIEVGRSPDEVFAPETLASFENKPITVEHPHEDVNIENYKDYAVGFVRDVKQGKFDGQDVILGTLVITDKDAIEGIENGEHVELSCGYDCDIEDGDDGYQQRHIRGNHVALCEAGRAGIAKIVDSMNDEDTVKYKGYTLKLHKGYNTWLNMKDYYEVFDERGNKIAMKKDLKSAKEYVDKNFTNDSVEDSEDIIKNGTISGADVEKALMRAKYLREMRSSQNCCILLGRKKSTQVFVLCLISSMGSKDAYDAQTEIDVDYNDHKTNPQMLKRFEYSTLKDALKHTDEIARYANELYQKATVGDSDVYDSKVNDAKKYAVEFTYGGDEWSPYLGQVWVYANSEKEALKKAEEYASNHSPYSRDYVYGSGKIVPKAYSNSPVIDSVEDAGEPRLDRAQRQMLQNYLSMISTFTSRETDIKDVLRPLSGKGFKYTIDKIEGWIWKKGEMAYKNYYISLDGYKDKFMVTLYADPDKDWKVNEVNAYFTDSVKDAVRLIEKYKGYEIWYAQSDNKKVTHVDIKKNGRFIQSADNVKEAEKEIDDLTKIRKYKFTYLIEYSNGTTGEVSEEFGATEDTAKDKAYEILAKNKLPRGRWISLINLETNKEIKDSTPDEEQTTMLEKDLEHFEDVDPRSGESKEDFIARFMKETKNEYPDEKQRLAVAYSYWENKGRDSKIKDESGISPELLNSFELMLKQQGIEFTRTSRTADRVNYNALIKKYPRKTTNFVTEWCSYRGLDCEWSSQDSKSCRFHIQKIKMLPGKQPHGGEIVKLRKTGERVYVTGWAPRGTITYEDKTGKSGVASIEEYDRLLDSQSKDSNVNGINPDYQNCLRELDKDVNQLYKLYQHGDKAPSTILRNMGYKEVGDNRFMMRSGLNKMIIEFDDFSDYIKYYFVDESGKIPKGYTVTKFKFYDSKPKDSIYTITIQGQKSKKLVRAKDAREAIDKYNKMFQKDKIKFVKKTDKFNNIIDIIGR